MLTDMEELIATVPDKDVAAYLREALQCHGAGAYRGCIVLSHIMLSAFGNSGTFLGEVPTTLGLQPSGLRVTKGHFRWGCRHSSPRPRAVRSPV
jgi:hypothetical protein